MKRFLQNMPIRRKQAIVLMLTSGLALLLASAIVIVHATYDFRNELLEGMDILAAVTGNDARSALHANDSKSGEEALAALQAEPEASAACVYDRERKVFASYKFAGLTDNIPLPPMRETGHEIRDGRMYTFYAIKEKQETIGGICIISSLEEIPEHFRRYAAMVGVVFVVAMLLVFIVSSRLHWLISDPIHQLAQVAHAVASQKNYSLRAQKEGHDEIGELVDGFNEMLTEIQTRDLALQTARDNLERRVEQRTQDLQKEVEERSRAQQALVESQALYHSLVEQLPMGVFRKDSAGRYVFINSWICRLKGIKAEEMLGRTPQELAAQELAGQDALLPEVTQLANQGTDHHKLIMETGRQIEMEEEYPLIEGRPHYLQVVKLPVFGPDGTVTGSQGIMFDITARKQADRAMRESQALYHSLVEQMPTGIFRKDAQGRYVFVNARFCQIKGVKAEDVLGKTPQEVATGDSEQAAIAWAATMKAQGTDHHATIMQTGRQIETEEEYLGADGNTQYLHVVKLPVFGPDGKIIGTQGVMIDITARKLAEAEAAYERDLLKALLDNLPDIIFFKDLESRFVRVSRSKLDKEFKAALKRHHEAHPAADAQGLPTHLRSVEQFHEYLIGKSDADLLPTDSARTFSAEEREVIRTGKPVIGNLIKTPLLNGKTGWYLVTRMPWRDKQGKIIGTFGTSKDVTAIKEAETQLAEASALMNTLLANTPDHIYFKDRESRFIRCSASMAAMFKVDTVDKVVGKSDKDFFGEEHALEAFQDEQKIMGTGQPIVGKTEKETWPDGHITWALTTKMPLRDANNEIIGTFGISKDITPLKDAEAKLKEVHSDLVQTSRRAGMADVATSVLHNVGNVLNSVNTSAGLIAERLRKSKMSGISRVVDMFEEHQRDLMGFLSQEGRREQLTTYLKTLAQHLASEQTAMLNEVQELTSNVEHIKEIVAMQQSYAKVSGVREIQNPSALMEDALRMHTAALLRHEVRVERQYENLPDASLDKHKVLQILINLISNAKYAMTDTPPETRRLTVGVDNDDGRVRFIIADNGVGIAPDNLTRIFSLGFTTRDNGHGFGLHSGFLAAREMGGELRVQSEGPGRGATFILELPIADLTQAAA